MLNCWEQWEQVEIDYKKSCISSCLLAYGSSQCVPNVLTKDTNYSTRMLLTALCRMQIRWTFSFPTRILWVRRVVSLLSLETFNQPLACHARMIDSGSKPAPLSNSSKRFRIKPIVVQDDSPSGNDTPAFQRPAHPWRGCFSLPPFL